MTPLLVRGGQTLIKIFIGGVDSTNNKREINVLLYSSVGKNNAYPDL